MSENRQDWDSKDYQAFLEHFYRMQLKIAMRVTKDSMLDDFTALTIAVFDKLATPAVYLKAEYAKWKGKRGDDKFTDAHSTERPTKSKADTDERWKVSPKNATILWCSERDATEEEMVIAVSKDSSIWYMKAREGYQYGAIFKKVKP